MLEPHEIAALVSVARDAKIDDPRNRERFARILEVAAADPTFSFPKMFANKSADLEGAYRFFANPAVTPDAILSSHFEATCKASASESTVLVVHDTSTFSFNPDGNREGLGRVRSTGQAFFAHVSLVLADDGSRRPLGLAALKTWIRGEAPAHGEEDRWLENIELAAARLRGTDHLLHVMDREADAYEFIAHLKQRGHRFVIRMKHDRKLVQVIATDPRNIGQALAKIECVVQRKAKLSKRIDGSRSPKQKQAHPSRGTRIAKLSIGAMPLTLERPHHHDKTLPASLSLNLVRVWETEPPDGLDPIEWVLLTSEPIDTADAIVRIVDQYRVRWVIEEYFKAIKSGCSFKERQLGDYEGLVTALAVFVPIACRLLLLRSEAHRAPDSPAQRVLDDDELYVLRKLGRKPLPDAPTARDVLLAVAALGGHIKWAGDPGWLTISRGFTELTSVTRGYRLARLQHDCDQR